MYRTSVLFVPVHRFFSPEMTLNELEPFVDRFWPMTASKAMRADRVVAYPGFAAAAWRLRYAFTWEGTSYQVSASDERKRIGLSLGDPLPVLLEYQLDLPNLQRPRIIEIDVKPFEPERDLT